VDEPATAAAAASGADEMTGLVLDSTAADDEDVMTGNDADVVVNVAGDAGLYTVEVGDDDDGCNVRSKHTRLGRRTVSVLSTRSTQRAQTSADPEDPDFGLWTPRSEA